MAAQTRVYVVVRRDAEPKGESRRLVRSAHPATALRHVADSEYSVSVASQDELIALLGKGIRVEEVGQEQAELPTT